MATTRRKPSSASNVTPLRRDLAAQQVQETKERTGRRSFGRIDQLPSGMFRARYPDPEDPRRRIAADSDDGGGSPAAVVLTLPLTDFGS